MVTWYFVNLFIQWAVVLLSELHHSFWSVHMMFESCSDLDLLEEVLNGDIVLVNPSR